MTTIFSEQNAEAFISTAAAVGLEITATNNVATFSKQLTTAHQHVIIHVVTERCIQELEASMFQINAILATGRVKTLKLIVPKEYKEFTTRFNIPQDTDSYYIDRPISVEIIKEALALQFAGEELYGDGKPARTPIMDSSLNNSHQSMLSGFIKELLSATPGAMTLETMQAKNASLNTERKQRREELDASAPTEMDSEFYNKLAKEGELIDAVYDIAIARNASQAAPAILQKTVEEASTRMQQVASQIAQTERLKTIETDQSKIEAKLSQVRTDAKDVFAYSDEVREKLSVLKQNLQLPVMDKSSLTDLIEENKDVLDPQSAIALYETAVAVASSQRQISPKFIEAVSELSNQQRKLTAAFNNVVVGYEEVVTDAFSLIDKLKSTASIEFTVDNKLAANLMLVMGTPQSGTTNYALCSAYAASAKSKSCVIDLKTENPQLHYYIPNGMELRELMSKSMNELQDFVKDTMHRNPFLAITNKQSAIVSGQYSPKQLNEFLIDLLNVLTEADVVTYAILNRKNCPIKEKLDTLAVMSTLVTDTNIGKTLEFSNLTKLSLMNKHVKHRILAVTKVNEFDVNVFLKQAGVNTNRFAVQAIPSLPIDLYKLQGAIFAASNSWRW